MVRKDEKVRELLMGASVHIIPFMVVSHLVVYHTDLYTSCVENHIHPLSFVFLGDVIPHYLILFFYIFSYKQINSKLDIKSLYFWSGLIGFILLYIIYGFMVGWKENIYHMSFITLTMLYIPLLVLSALILFKEKKVIKKDETSKNMLLL